VENIFIMSQKTINYSSLLRIIPIVILIVIALFYLKKSFQNFSPNIILQLTNVNDFLIFTSISE
jgi:amino acid transporter